MALLPTRRIELNARNVALILFCLALIAALVVFFLPRGEAPNADRISRSQTTSSQSARASRGLDEPSRPLQNRTDLANNEDRPFNLFAKLDEARKQHKHVLAYFFRKGDAHRWDELIEKAKRNWPRELVVAYVPMEDAKAQPLLRKYGLRFSPTILVFAPNGAVTGGYIRNAPNLSMLARTIVSEKMAEVILSVQEKHFVFLLLGQEGDNVFQQNLQVARNSADELEGMANVVSIDRRKDEASDIMANLGISQSSDASHTYVISPAGGLVAHFEGAITEETLFDSFSKVLAQKKGCGAKTVTGGSSCEPGRGVAGSGGCGARGRSLQ